MKVFPFFCLSSSLATACNYSNRAIDIPESTASHRYAYNYSHACQQTICSSGSSSDANRQISSAGFTCYTCVRTDASLRATDSPDATGSTDRLTTPDGHVRLRVRNSVPRTRDGRRAECRLSFNSTDLRIAYRYLASKLFIFEHQIPDSRSRH